MNTLEFKCAWPIVATLALTLSGCRNGWNPIANFRANSFMQVPHDALKSQPMPKLTAEKRVNMQLALIQSFEKKGEFDQAITACEELHRKAPKRTDVVHRLAVLYDKQGSPEQADKYYALALEREPRNPEILCDAGYGQYLSGNYQRAEQYLSKSLQYSPRLARAHNNLGLVLAHTNRHDAALAEFTNAGCAPAQARTSLAHAMIWDHHYAAAEEQLVLALQMDRSQQGPANSLAQVRSLRSKEPAAPIPQQAAIVPAAAQIQHLPSPVQPVAAYIANEPLNQESRSDIVAAPALAPARSASVTSEVPVAGFEKLVESDTISPLPPVVPAPDPTPTVIRVTTAGTPGGPSKIGFRQQAK